MELKLAGREPGTFSICKSGDTTFHIFLHQIRSFNYNFRINCIYPMNTTLHLTFTQYIQKFIYNNTILYIYTKLHTSGTSLAIICCLLFLKGKLARYIHKHRIVFFHTHFIRNQPIKIALAIIYNLLLTIHGCSYPEYKKNQFSII